MNPDDRRSPGSGVAGPAESVTIIPLPESHVRRWDDELIVYDQRCGETHLLQGVVAMLFEWLREGPCTADALAERLSAEQVDGVGDTYTFVRQVLNELQRLQLLEVSPVEDQQASQS
ncbi:hypothetical protein B1C78_16035 [Thioalkalivibrio denitrificans]|uniref:PqqD family protein n=1 Tax=Thioalkalivibrio denitrificans TaxID=108003 RepID=A0A1V3N9L2_9GAMM|nr:HPr-rel-A system PqqD family peptide chaperone [Thioalkalivibrio denitrificans]OOG21789.1 hypothetical protein B1C78_16035 [Thioalkalivibrio denitrificans]